MKRRSLLLSFAACAFAGNSAAQKQSALLPQVNQPSASQQQRIVLRYFHEVLDGSG